MRVFEHGRSEISFVPSGYVSGDSEHFFVSKLGMGHSVGQLALLSEIPTKDIEAIMAGDPAVFAKYLQPDPEQRGRFIPQERDGVQLRLYDAPYGRPVVVHDYLIEVGIANVLGPPPLPVRRD